MYIWYKLSRIGGGIQSGSDILRRVWRYQRGNQNPYIKEEQTTQLPKEKVQKDKQRSTNHTHKAKDRVTRILLKNLNLVTSYSLKQHVTMLLAIMFVSLNHTCDRVAMLQLEICKFLAGDLVS